MTKKGKSQGVLFERGMPVPRITVKERKKIKDEIERTDAKLRKKYPEIHGKVVDFIRESVSDGILYVGIQFTDKTVFSLRYRSDISMVSADYLDGKTGDYDVVREYMKPIPR